MREIKFRAWDDINKQMVYEHVNHHSFTYFGPGEILKRFPIVMQFTGLTDKNGVEIYEGDLYNFKGHICKIVWRENFCDFVFKTVKYNSRVLNVTKANITEYECERIGNIHQNPELL